MGKSRYTTESHRIAFNYWKSGMTLREISEQEGMPSREMLSRWKNGDVKCECKWHDWEALYAGIAKDAYDEVEDELSDPKEVEKKKIKQIIEIQGDFLDLWNPDNLGPPKNFKEAKQFVDTLGKLINQERLLKGESTEINEIKGAERKTLNISEVLNQLNVGEDVTEDELIEAVEDQYVEGTNDGSD